MCKVSGPSEHFEMVFGPFRVIFSEFDSDILTGQDRAGRGYSEFGHENG